jgi:hypothetical protein
MSVRDDTISTKTAQSPFLMKCVLNVLFATPARFINSTGRPPLTYWRQRPSLKLASVEPHIRSVAHLAIDH